jgi:hypothetical protein
MLLGHHADITVQSVLGSAVLAEMLSKPYFAKVPAHAPLTRKQYEESVQYWPVNFHEDKRSVKAVSNE